MNAAIVAGAVALLAFAWSLLAVPRELEARAYYELAFSGGGHVLQFASSALLVAWLLLADASGVRVPDIAARRRAAVRHPARRGVRDDARLPRLRRHVGRAPPAADLAHAHRRRARDSRRRAGGRRRSRAARARRPGAGAGAPAARRARRLARAVRRRRRDRLPDRRQQRQDSRALSRRDRRRDDRDDGSHLLAAAAAGRRGAAREARSLAIGALRHRAR